MFLYCTPPKYEYEYLPRRRLLLVPSCVAWMILRVTSRSCGRGGRVGGRRRRVRLVGPAAAAVGGLAVVHRFDWYEEKISENMDPVPTFSAYHT